MKYIDHAQSFDNGIVCYSNICPIIGVYTYYNNEGKIKKKKVLMSDIIKKTEIERENDLLLEAEPEILIRYIFFMLTVCLFALTQSYIFTLVYCVLSFNRTLDAYEMFFRLIRQFKQKDGSKKGLAKIHAAEHMMINAYKEKQRIPSYKEVESKSRFSPECGTLNFFNRVFTDTVIALSLLLAYYFAMFFSKKTVDNFGLLVAIVVIIVLFSVFVGFSLKFLTKYGLLKFMEVFVTEKPTKREINLAIQAVKNFEIMEKNIHKDLEENFKLLGKYKIVFIVDGEIQEKNDL